MRVAKEICDALSDKWPNLHIEGWDDDEALDVVMGCLKRLRGKLVEADSELSAIAHGRPQSSKQELSKLYSGIRWEYEGGEG